MLSMSNFPPSINGALGGAMDASGTINPAALSGASPRAMNYPQPSPRGVKRSWSPDVPSDAAGDQGDDENQRRKRGRLANPQVPEKPSPGSLSMPATGQAPSQTPQMSSQLLPQMSPPQPSPTKTTPTKGATAMKALPTVRDHSTDQLNSDGDEFVPRTLDDAGEAKVKPNGALTGSREYKCRTFFVPNRGDKLFMLATECARVLGYRDSYLLFNKNKSLVKIIANQDEKDDLIQQEMLPYSYRSRQIAIVTARSMFRQFGAKVIVNGRRVRDDYFEAFARKQGFTEEDAAGEKRPGATRAREAAQAEANTAAMLAAMPHREIIYSNGPGDSLSASALGPIPMINIAPTDDLRPRDYGSVQRPRHEMTGQPYQDRTQASPPSEILTQAANASEFNKQLGQQRTGRTTYLEDMWRRPHEPVIPTVQPVTEGETSAPVTQAFQSPQLSTTGAIAGGPQAMLPPNPQAPPQMINTPAYQQSQQHQQPMMAQSPNRPMHPQLQQRSPSVPGGHPQQPGYGYPQNAMMYQQPQVSPMQQAHPGYQQYPGQMAPSPHAQSPMHPPPQLHHASSGGAMHGQNMGYPNMAAAMNTQYANMPRNMYAPSPSPQHYMQSAATTQPGMPGWAPGPQPPPGGWQGY